MSYYEVTFFPVLQSGSEESAGTQVLVLGLDGAGKTSLLSCWSMGSPEVDVKPTQGFNAVSINRDDLHVDFLESEYSPVVTGGPPLFSETGSVCLSSL